MPPSASGCRRLNARAWNTTQVLLHAKPKGDSQLPLDLETQLRNLFGKMDRDRDQILSKASCLPPQACVL